MKADIFENKIIYWFLFGMISLLFVATRLFRLDMAPFTPIGMHYDEMSAAYDAWCVQGWGCDRHLTRFPVYFMNAGSGQNALYIYLAAIMFKLAGFSLFKFRLVAVICAGVAYICLFFLSRILFGRNIASLIPNALMVIMPIFVMSEHWGLESYLFLSFSIISIYFMIIALDKGRLRYSILSGFLWGITFYTYGISYVVIPLFLLLTLVLLIYEKKIEIVQIFAVGIPVIIMGVPLAVEQLVINGYIKPFSLAFMDFFPMEITRFGEVSISNIPENLRTSLVTLFSKDSLFYNSVPLFGTIYYISIPFMMIGLILSIQCTVKSVRKKEYSPVSIVLLYYVSARIVSLMTFELNINKANELFFPYLLFTAYGIIYIYSKLSKSWFLPLIAVVYAAFFLCFARWAYSNGEQSWNYETRPRTEEGIVKDIQVGRAIQEARMISGDKHMQMIINDVRGRYLQICLFAGTSPYDYNEEGYSENGYEIGISEELDMSGDTIFLIEDSLDHITDYLVSEGFKSTIPRNGGFSIVYR